FFLSRLDTSHLKDSLTAGAGRGMARKVLVVVQFLISVALIIGTISAFSQLNYLKNADLGFDRDQVILLPTKFDLAMHFETFNIPVVEGRAFSRDFSSDTSEAVMINESMVKHLGWTNEEAIGKAIRSDRNERVIGVFSDFNALSLHKPAGNFILDMLAHPRGSAAQTKYMAVKVNTNDYKGVLKYIGMVWNDFAPTRPFEYSFLDEELNALYKDESSFSKLSIILTILAIVIACLGLIGLTSFMVERKTKEISVRRVHGATVSNVNTLLSKEFLLLIMIANLISWPIAWFGINRWLENFSRHIDIQWYLFLVSALVTIIMTVTITSIHAYRASRMNPADTLKYE
ncbi:MAG: FtsX-like permease family protein, partial [Bacteroidales bacterium]|nr:FtsX-like permease family protein [Bacteroidales bacterium]